VAFDGRWQGDFEEREEALAWARAVGETGRITNVASFGRGLKKTLIRPKLVAVFPEDHTRGKTPVAGTRSWKLGGMEPRRALIIL
jgi:hypothetical protein